MKFFRPKKATGFTLVEIMIVVLIIGILLAIAIPNFVSARESSRAKACVGNLKQIDSATQQWCMDKKKSTANYGTGPVISTDLVLPIGANYIRAMPVCPSAGTYAAAATVTGTPQCTVSGAGTANTDTNYNGGGKFYHGL
jgi:prepilin-type N-terminal cleavage/methylation domain-containing protein